MKILVIGHSVEDHIHQNDEEVIKPGGIYYSVLGLTKVISSDDEIHLVTALQKDKEDLFSEIYNKIDKNHINWVNEIPKVHLIIHESEERTECYENIPQNLEVDYKLLHNYDGILINMITGFDITLEQLKTIRRNFDGLIYFDVHTLSRGFNESKTRTFKLIENFSRWAAEVDIIQTNQYELKTLFNFNNKLEIARQVLNSGTTILVETRAEDGACIYFNNNSSIETFCIEAEKVEPYNKVGCGDIFGSVFFYIYLKSQNAKESLIAANSAAGQSASKKY